MTLLVKVVLFVAPSLLLAVRPQAEIGVHNANIQQLTDEKMTKSGVQPAQALSVNDDKVDIHNGQHKKEQPQRHSHSKASSTHNSSEVHAAHAGKKASVSAEGKVAATGDGGDLAENWKYWLYSLMESSEGGIAKEGWDKVVVGQWAVPLWKVMDKNADGTIDEAEFQGGWDQGITDAFEAMGGSKDSEIKPANVDKWDATENQKKFAKSEKFMGDGGMDRGEFEEFLYCAMVLRAIDADEDGKVTWDEVVANKNVNGKLGADEAAFNRAFPGAEGMDIGKLDDFLEKTKVFTPATGYNYEDGGGARAVLAATVAVVLMLASSQ